QALAEAQAGIDAGAVGRAFDAAAKLGLAGTQLTLEVVELGQAVDEEAAADMAAIDAEVGAVQVVAAPAVAGEAQLVMGMACGHAEHRLLPVLAPDAVVACLHAVPAAVGGHVALDGAATEVEATAVLEVQPAGMAFQPHAVAAAHAHRGTIARRQHA